MRHTLPAFEHSKDPFLCHLWPWQNLESFVNDSNKFRMAGFRQCCQQLCRDSIPCFVLIASFLGYFLFNLFAVVASSSNSGRSIPWPSLPFYKFFASHCKRQPWKPSQATKAHYFHRPVRLCEELKWNAHLPFPCFSLGLAAGEGFFP